MEDKTVQYAMSVEIGIFINKIQIFQLSQIPNSALKA